MASAENQISSSPKQLKTNVTSNRREHYSLLRQRAAAGTIRGAGTSAAANENATCNGAANGVPLSTAKKPIKVAPGKSLCLVTMLDGTEEHFEVEKNALGHVLIDLVCRQLDLAEREYFGITFRDRNHMVFWLSAEKTIRKQVGKSLWRFEFQVRFYPPHPRVMREELTRYYLCLQVRQDLVCGKLPCSFHTLAILGAYVVQSELGDHSAERRPGLDYLREMPFAPERFQNGDLLARIVELHKQLEGLPPEQADGCFLNNARKLAMYGVELQKCTDSKSDEVMMGVFYGGIHLYRGRLRINHFPWAMILKVSYTGRILRLIAKPLEGEQAERPYEFRFANNLLTLYMWQSVVEQHGFFRLRESDHPHRPAMLFALGNRRFRYSGPTLYQAQSSRPGRTQPTVKHNPITRIQERDQHDWYATLKKEKRRGDASRANNRCTQSTSVAVNTEVAVPLGTGPRPACINQSESEARRPRLPPARWRISGADRSTGLMLETDSGLAVATAVAAAGEDDWLGCRSNWGISGRGGGRFYYETTVMGQGPVRIGWSNNEGVLRLGEDRWGFAYGGVEERRPRMVRRNDFEGTGVKVFGGEMTPYGEPVVSGDVIGCFLDLEDGSVSWCRNGLEMGFGFRVPAEMMDEAFFPAACVKDSSVVFNFGESEIAYAPRGSWTPVSLVEPCRLIANERQGWRINPYDVTEAVQIAPDALAIQAVMGGGWQGLRATCGVRIHGRYYYEARILEEPCMALIGWSTEDARLLLASDRLGFGYGVDREGVGLRKGLGKKMHNDETETYGEPLCSGDVIGCFLDLQSWSIHWARNGREFGPGYRIRPDIRSQALFPAAALKEVTVEFNFGDFPFKHMPEGTWVGVSTAPEDTVRYSKKKGPEKKVKGWTYSIDQETLDHKLRMRRQRISQLAGQQSDSRRQSYGSTRDQPIGSGAGSRASTNQNSPVHSPMNSLGGATANPTRVGMPSGGVIGNGMPSQPPPSYTWTEEHVHQPQIARVQGTQPMREVEYRTFDRNEPDMETVTYTDQEGNTVTRVVKRTKLLTKVTTTGRSTLPPDLDPMEVGFNIPTVATRVTRYTPRDSGNDSQGDVRLTTVVPSVLTTTTFYRPASQSPMRLSPAKIRTGSV